MKWMGFHSRFQLKLMNIESHPSGKRRSQFLEPSVFACFELNNFAFRDFNLFFCCKINTCTGFTHARSECSESMQCDSVFLLHYRLFDKIKCCFQGILCLFVCNTSFLGDALN